MKNKLIDLNNHLMAQMERLGDETKKGEELKQEVQRAEATAKIAAQVINNAALALKAAKTIQDGELENNDSDGNPMLEIIK